MITSKVEKHSVGLYDQDISIWANAVTQRAQKIIWLLVLMHRAAYRRDDDGTLYYADKTPPAPIKRL